MINVIWLLLIILAIVLGLINGTTSAVVLAMTASAKNAINLVIGLLGIMVLWMGIIQIAEDAGLISRLSRWLRPILQRVFPGIPAQHPAMGNIVMNIAANMLGAGNAATPLGLRAMRHLAELNPHKAVASDDMVTFLAINTSSVQLVPATAIAVLAANGDLMASHIIFPVLVATSCSTLAGVLSAKFLKKLPVFRV